jgi:hypothetical protein
VVAKVSERSANSPVSTQKQPNLCPNPEPKEQLTLDKSENDLPSSDAEGVALPFVARRPVIRSPRDPREDERIKRFRSENAKNEKDRVGKAGSSV